MTEEQARVFLNQLAGGGEAARRLADFINSNTKETAYENLKIAHGARQAEIDELREENEVLHNLISRMNDEMGESWWQRFLRAWSDWARGSRG